MPKNMSGLTQQHLESPTTDWEMVDKPQLSAQQVAQNVMKSIRNFERLLRRLEEMSPKKLLLMEKSRTKATSPKGLALAKLETACTQLKNFAAVEHGPDIDLVNPQVTNVMPIVEDGKPVAYYLSELESEQGPLHTILRLVEEKSLPRTRGVVMFGQSGMQSRVEIMKPVVQELQMCIGNLREQITSLREALGDNVSPSTEANANGDDMSVDSSFSSSSSLAC